MPLEERLQVVREQGFVCGHLALGKVIKEYSVKDEALTPGFAMYLKRLFQKNELDVASLLGCGVVGTETGAPNEAYQHEPACRSEEAMETFIYNLRPVVEYAEKMGVIMAIEPVWKHIVYDADRAKKVLDAINSPNLQIILDPVNLLGIENYKNQVEIVEHAIEVLGDQVAVVHIKDYVVKDDELVSVAAGTGQMNYDALIRFMKERKPYIHATLENTTPENAVESRKYIQGLWDRCEVK